MPVDRDSNGCHNATMAPVDDKQITIRMTAAQRRAIQDAASRADMSLSGFIRERVAVAVMRAEGKGGDLSEEMVNVPMPSNHKKALDRVSKRLGMSPATFAREAVLADINALELSPAAVAHKAGKRR